MQLEKSKKCVPSPYCLQKAASLPNDCKLTYRNPPLTYETSTVKFKPGIHTDLVVNRGGTPTHEALLIITCVCIVTKCESIGCSWKRKGNVTATVLLNYNFIVTHMSIGDARDIYNASPLCVCMDHVFSWHEHTRLM